MSENKLLKYVLDDSLIDYYYLKLSVDELIYRLHGLKFVLTGDKSFVPFNAQLRDYSGAIDSENNKWILKKIDNAELFDHLLFEIAFYLDFMMQTLAIPSITARIGSDLYRVSKLVSNGMQIGSYNYMINPFLKVLTNDLINRWLYFDEDRNPNNYMVIHNSKQEPLIVAIDYNKADLNSDEMKITGNDEKFGWFRQEKTRFLTLLKPSNFENLSIDNFEYRLEQMMGIKKEKLEEICCLVFKDHFKDYKERSERITANIFKRREYINKYFRTWFKPGNETNNNKNSEYKDMGNSFLNKYKDK
jgi:hypothetical protein